MNLRCVYVSSFWMTKGVQSSRHWSPGNPFSRLPSIVSSGFHKGLN